MTQPVAEARVADGLLGGYQHTLGKPVSRQGVGLHSGAEVAVAIHPAEANQGRYFVRVDLPNQPIIPARCDAVDQTVLSTELRQGNAAIRTVEHLLAALSGLGIDNARIEVNGPELPLLDGSAQSWAEAIASAQPVLQSALRPQGELADPIWIRDGDAFVAALPADSPRFTYGIDFEVAAIGNQWHSWSPTSSQSFLSDIAPARTFGLAHQVDYLRAQGLIKGGSLDNALVCEGDRWLNPPLRFANEPVRHKLLDLIGDLSLLGALPRAHILAYKASHQLHVQLAQALQANLEFA
ncbi:UDP-3-O-[3-hydroxymyristoyl] N-acetylglucosamine deacetylase [filamentous cyanobacterium CCP5]|nr:UDP-3-O-[3-hydroxymyristoyl] N-acetylglucosamine deacetylase [filamentous cyanobacterium CCP5]